MMKQARTRAMFSLTVLLACCACTFALDPSLAVSQYAHTSWKVRDGFTRGRIQTVAQTPDGYLWLGTEFGLVRFDGVRAVPWQPPKNQHLPPGPIYSLLVSRNGTLWIGTTAGLASWKESKLSLFPQLDGVGIYTLLEDREGTIWVGAGGRPNAGRLCAIRNGSMNCFGGDGGLGPGVPALVEDRNGNLWAGVEAGLWRWKPGPPKLFPLPGELDGIQALSEDNDGALLMGWKGRIYQFIDGKTQPYSFVGVLSQFRANRMLRDRDGGLWIGTIDKGLVHVHLGRVDLFSAADGLSGDDVQSLFEDREGNIWVSTVDGFDHFRHLSVSTFRVKQGLSGNLVGSILADRDGSLWLATYGGMNRWDQGQITIPQMRSATHDGKINGSVPNCLFRDDKGRIWLSTPREVGYLQNGHFNPIKGAPPGNVLSIDQDTASHRWVINEPLGLIDISPQNDIRQISWSELGHKDNASVLAVDHRLGGLWIGFFLGGVSYFSDGKTRTSYTAADGLGAGRVSDFLFDNDGTLWISTEGGLSRLKNHYLATLTGKNGLPCDTVHWAIEDEDHAMWLYTACGLVRIPRSELDAWSAAADKQQDAARKVQVSVFDSSDGVRSLASPGHYHPQVAKTPDGKLWFLPWDGVSVIDPHHIPFNKIPPPVHIEKITADDKTYEVANGMRLPARVRNLDIDYTALSLVSPEKIHFRYKLEGQDSDWREVVNDRKVQYSNLPPKHYRFRVIACNNNGVWNEEGASLDFNIPPAWYQTLWFRAVCVAALFLLLWSAHLLRVRHLRNQEKKLRDVVETMPTFAWTALPDGSVDFVNRHWQEFTGLSTEKTVGSGWESAVHSADLKRHVEKWRASLATGEPFENEVRYRQGEDGQYRWFLARAVPLRDGKGNVVKWYGVSTDIEDRKRAEQEREKLREDLSHVNRVSMLGELSASLSHELKQPITAAVISANTTLEWLNRKQPDVENARESTATIVTAGMRAAEIIDRLRSLYKKAPPQRQLLDVNEIVGEMIALLRSEGNSYAISMRAHLAPDLPHVMADRVQLQQVLMNLMLNAIEAMKETGGMLTVKSQPQDGHVVVSVSDTGLGLPREKAERIFDAFFTTKPQGSGMGLAISRSIIESHGGRLWATPNNGRGASFHFSLPTAVHAEEKPAAGA